MPFSEEPSAAPSPAGRRRRAAPGSGGPGTNRQTGATGSTAGGPAGADGDSRLVRRLRQLTGLYGPSGREDAVRDAVAAAIRPLVDELQVDALGNLIARRAPRGTEPHGRDGRRILVTAHMDEIALIAVDVDARGFVRFETVGGHDATVLLGQRVAFPGGVVGVIGREKTENRKDLPVSKLFIDIGARSQDEAREKVRIGDMAVFHQPLERAGGRLIAKAMDDRAGCAVLIEALERLDRSPHEIYAVFTVQEEVGLRGARTAAFGVDPDVAVAVDITFAGDTPEPEHRIAVELGKGPAIKVKDASLISHGRVREWMARVAENRGIPHQYEVLPFGGTDAGAMQLVRAGIPAGTLSIPTRYAHTPVEMVEERDLEHAVQLLVAMLEEPLP